MLAKPYASLQAKCGGFLSRQGSIEMAGCGSASLFDDAPYEALP